MKRLFLTLLTICFVGCSQVPVPGNHAVVQSEKPQNTQVQQNIDKANNSATQVSQNIQKTKTSVSGGQNSVDNAVNSTNSDLTIANQIKKQGVTANNPVVDKLIEGLQQTNMELFKVRADLRDAQDALDDANKQNDVVVNSLNIATTQNAVLQTKIDTQTKELKTRTDAFNAETDKNVILVKDLTAEKIKTQEETDRANGWRKKFWWAFGLILVWIVLKTAKVWGKLAIPFI